MIKRSTILFICIFILSIYGLFYQFFPIISILDKIFRNIIILIVISIGVKSIFVSRYGIFFTIIYIMFCIYSVFIKKIPLGDSFIALATHYLPIGSLFLWRNISSREGIKRLFYFRKLLVYLAMIQLPVIILQFVFVDNWDDIGGTFGAGGTPMLCYFLFMLVGSFLLEDNIGIKSSRKYIYLFLLIPTLFNETKIAYLFLIVLISLISIKKIKLRNIIVGLLIISITFVFAYKALDFVYKSKGSEYGAQIYFQKGKILEYFTGTKKTKFGEDIDIPRFMKLVITMRYLRENNALIDGFGIGALRIDSSDIIISQIAFGTKILPVVALANGGMLYMLFVLCIIIYSHIAKNKDIPMILSRYSNFLIFLTSIGMFYQSLHFSPLYSMIFPFFIEMARLTAFDKKLSKIKLLATLST